MTIETSKPESMKDFLETNPEAFKTPVMRVDDTITAKAVPKLMKDLLALGGDRYYLSEVSTENLGRENPDGNLFQLVFKRIKT